MRRELQTVSEVRAVLQSKSIGVLYNGPICERVRERDPDLHHVRPSLDVRLPYLVGTFERRISRREVRHERHPPLKKGLLELLATRHPRPPPPLARRY